MSDHEKPCPFCGSDDLGIGQGAEYPEGQSTYVFCGTCGAQGPWIYTRDTGSDVAVACEATGWNKRPDPDLVTKPTSLPEGPPRANAEAVAMLWRLSGLMGELAGRTAEEANEAFDKGDYHDELFGEARAYRACKKRIEQEIRWLEGATEEASQGTPETCF